MTNNTVQSLTPKAAWQFLQDNPQALLIDVRSEMEFLFVGHPLGAIHIAWIDEPDWAINPNFVPDVLETVQKRLQLDDMEVAKQQALLLICRSGVRSLDAGYVLCEEGFSTIYNVAEGFEGKLDEKQQRGHLNGWRFHGLPWQQC